jgi:hypothetical protein
MMKQILLVCLMALVASAASAFAPKYQTQRKTALNLAVMPPVPPAEMSFATEQQQRPAFAQQSSSPLNNGVQMYVDNHLQSSSSVTLSLQERRPPTPEEVAAKKRNFLLWFWGGGFVAPFLATIFYFGFKFWEK